MYITKSLELSINLFFIIIWDKKQSLSGSKERKNPLALCLSVHKRMQYTIAWHNLVLLHREPRFSTPNKQEHVE